MLPDNFSSSFLPQLKNSFAQPILASLLENQPLCLAMGGATLLHAGAMVMGWPGWVCPLRYGLGVPCPGCGLSRAMLALLRGEWATSLNLHAFAPFFLMALILISLAMVLPAPQRQRLVGRVKWLEQRSGVTAILLVALVFYWLIRLLFFRAAFFNLIMG
jgi:hypothetical protein